jgi:hypothetical protein
MNPSLLGDKTIRRVQQVNTDGDTEIYFPLDTLKSQPNTPWEKCHHCLCTYHLINKNLSEKKSNEKKYKKYLDFIVGWVRSWTEEIESKEEYVESFKRFEEFTGRRTTMEVLGVERRKDLYDYIAFTWIPNRGTLQRHHRMEVRSMEEKTMASAEHNHSSKKKCEDCVKHHHGIAKTTLDKNSRKCN